MENILIPAFSSVPLSSPTWLFVFFLVFTFFLHILFVNLTLGGTILLLVSKYISKVFGNNTYDEIAEEIGYLNTFNISFAVTLGVAPLLFLQTMYENFFYTSSILLSWKWLFVLAAIIFAYYFYYLYKFKPWYIKFSGGKGIIFIVFAAIMFLYVALIFVTNTTLSMQPELWAEVYTGKISAFSVKTLVPRLIHFVLAAIAFSGLFLMVYSKFRKNYSATLKDTMYNFGKKAFFYTTLAQIIVGIWFLFSHEKDIYMLLMGKNIVGTLFLLISIVLTVFALFYVYKNKENIFTLSALVLLIIASMVIVRRVVETGFFEKYFKLSELNAEPYWGIFAIFAILLVSLLVVIYYSLKRIVKDMKNKAGA
ncbi:hypothetical protein DSN97_00215 [Deferribacteraceae bacterium V6Fe1]|nr:hypothetical protein DSN97_00215 [Deferribacteraceae bacterium V6Fe1]